MLLRSGLVTLPLNRRVLSFTWPYVALVMIMLTLSVVSISATTAIRAYVGGESFWSKAERDSAFYLIRYSRSELEADYQAYESAAAVIQGDRKARLTLQEPWANTREAAKGFIAGRNAPADINGLIRLFMVFGDTGLMSKAIELWTEGDRLFDQLMTLGENLHWRIVKGPLSDVEADDYVVRIEALHRQLTPLADAFSVELGRTSRLVSTAMMWTLSVCSLGLLIAAIAVTRRMLERSDDISKALQLSQRAAFAEQERAQVTLHSIGDAVISITRDGQIEYLNTAAESLTGWRSLEAAGLPYGRVLQLVDDKSLNRVDTLLERVLTEARPLELTNAGMLVHRDGTRTPIDELAAPIRDREGEIVGIVLVLRDVTKERAMAEQLRFQASHDALTGLLNREEFERCLSELLQGPHPEDSEHEHAVIYMDLDQFKVVNDTCGHAAGDELIRQIGSQVLDELPDDAMLARLGGDEFGMLLPSIGLVQAIAVAEAIRQRIALYRFLRDEKSFSVGASLGVVSITPDMESNGAVLNAADRACYMAKDNGRNRVHVYRPDDAELNMRSGLMARVAQINNAIEDERLLLYGQEIRSLRRSPQGDSHIEVLIRMVNDEGKLVPPMSFIPAAERYGVMGRIDRWVISQAFSTLREMRAGARPLPRCMINLSGQSVADETLYDFIVDQFAEAGIAYDRIGFELTETSAITNMVVAVNLMRKLSTLGCVIALDDFGSGMSSFTYLRSMPVSYLKIDGHLVTDFRRNPVHRVMVQAIQQIAQVMGVKTVAEWVEDETTCEELTMIGIDYAQGYHIGRPEPLKGSLKRWREQHKASANAAPIGPTTARVSDARTDKRHAPVADARDIS